ncbi:MAG: ArsA family ATPase [Blastocatellia bacterium]|nr:ArsA family ATPase [Blastocatellia bacterium]MCS7156176.1 ArsA family ATPase [Blastocatellia bacterium]MCX7751474.1 ArsA family ATPase [Blastocatellia bacterium]MDW8169187.1 ArsA family ATPase [Acidobacteriota bacterium]MDW8256048.1 ArsA family ATPase [Acidobacteriota bacterium]
MKPRILLFSGKGGVGKTSVAAATGVRAAELGYRTIVLSLDIAHSLSDAFDLPVGLHEKNKGRPVRITDRLDIQEIDVQEELERWWSEVYKYLAAVFSAAGMGDLVAEEMAILPGMEEIVGLLYINQYLEERRYDVIILDCAPTGESLRFISLPSALEWFMDKIFHLERTVMRVVRPMAKPFAPIPLPDDSYYAAIERLYQRLKGVDKYLLDHQVTTARLVTNAEKMVVRETQRAFMYLCLYEIAVDAVIVNKLIPPHVMDAHFANWLKTQMGYVEQIEEYFAPIPILKAPLFESEIVGLERLRRLALELYGSQDPTLVLYAEKPYQYHFEDGRYFLQLKLPFASREHIDLYRDADELIIRIGSFKRHILLPHKLLKSRIRSASYKGDSLIIEFAEAQES